MSDQAASVGRLYSGVSTTRLTSIAFELAGSSATAWDDTDGAAAEIGNDYLLRQVSTLGGGTTEMAATSSPSASSACRAELSITATPRSATSPKARPPSSRPPLR